MDYYHVLRVRVEGLEVVGLRVVGVKVEGLEVVCVFIGVQVEGVEVGDEVGVRVVSI
jgi:hypothetical protein